MDSNHKWFWSIVLSLICSLGFMVNAFADEISSDSPVGYWKTIDDVTGKPKSIVQIWKTENNILMGRVIKVFAKNTTETVPILCAVCKGDKHNQPIVGMVILSGLQPKKHQWINGQITDPDNGKTYSCAMRTLEQGKKLNVRGYIGLPLLGRSQVWERVDLMSG